MRRHEEKLHSLPPNTPLDKEQHLREQKFRSERNFYLCLFTTTLLLYVINTSSLTAISILLRLEGIFRSQQKQIEELEKKVNLKAQ